VSVIGTRHPSERESVAARRIAGTLAEGIDTHTITEAHACSGHVIGITGTPIGPSVPVNVDTGN